MLLYEKINSVLQVLGCSGAELAKKSGLDASLISRYRTGERLPKQNSPRLLSLCKGIEALAGEKGREAALYTLCGRNDSRLSLSDCLLRWFCTSDLYFKPPAARGNKTRYVLNGFGAKLDRLMNGLSVSNIRLAKQLNVDASLISRLRSGKRTIRSDSLLVDGICHYFALRAEHSDERLKLYELLSLSNNNEFYSEESVKTHITDWLCHSDYGLSAPVLSAFFEELVSIDKSVYDKMLPEYVGSETLFFGQDGFLLSLISLLKTARKEEAPGQLLIYIDQSLTRTFGNNAALGQVFTLMNSLVKRGFSFQIIHSLGNKLSLLFEPLTCWLPLLLSGSTELYSIKKTELLFSHTVAILPDKASVTSSFLSEHEETACCEFSINPRKIHCLEAEFRQLLSRASLLAKIKKPGSSGFYLLSETDSFENCVSLKAVSGSLPFFTLPRRLFRELAAKSSNPEALLACYDRSRSRFQNFIEERSLEVFYQFPSAEQVRRGEVLLPLSIHYDGSPVFYTPETFTEHLMELLSLLGENKNFTLIPVSKTPDGIQLTVKTEPPEAAVKAERFPQAICFSGPILYSAFLMYCESLERLCGREELYGFFEKFVSALF